MPGMDGYELARQLRQLLGDRVVLIALTAFGHGAAKAQSRAAGFDHHMVKPADLDTLSELICSC